MKQLPTFPPLLKGHRIAAEKSVIKNAKARIAKGELGAGDLLWLDDLQNLNFCVVLEPEVARARCGEMLFLLMVAFGDALGALSPPEMAVTYQWPNDVQLNDASIGSCDLELSDAEINNIPEWMIVSINVSIKPENIMHDPGDEAWRTSLWEEGCGDISRVELLESTSRHFLNWLHNWSEDGFKPIHDQWIGRQNEKSKMQESISEGAFLGLDENGNALVRLGDETQIIATLDTLNKIRLAKVDVS